MNHLMFQSYDDKALQAWSVDKLIDNIISIDTTICKNILGYQAVGGLIAFLSKDDNKIQVTGSYKHVGSGVDQTIKNSLWIFPYKDPTGIYKAKFLLPSSIISLNEEDVVFISIHQPQKSKNIVKSIWIGICNNLLYKLGEKLCLKK